MPASNQFHLLPPAEIKVNRETRQRKEISLASRDMVALRASIAARGILNPLVVRRDNTLVAGERRLLCAIDLALAAIPVHYLDELESQEAEVAELEENVHRQDIPWQDFVRGVYRIHKIQQAKEPGWTEERTAAKLSLSEDLVNRCQVISNYAIVEPTVWKYEVFSRALTAATRYRHRAQSTALDKLMEIPDVVQERSKKKPAKNVQVSSASGMVADGDQDPEHADSKELHLEEEPPPPPPIILNESFLSFAPAYAGPRFNFLHCDFPYGIGIDDSDQFATSTGTKSYADDEEVYWELLSCLISNIDRLLLPSSHCMFWFSMAHYEATKKELSRVFAVNPFPLFWHKIDNKGLLPDAKRGPRRVYETAFLCSRGDRYIVRPVSNAISCQTARSFHVSCKPVPVLSHFFTMFVDEFTEMLDPTAGSGTSLIAAESLGAERTLGIELDPAYATQAEHEITLARNLRRLSRSSAQRRAHEAEARASQEAQAIEEAAHAPEP